MLGWRIAAVIIGVPMMILGTDMASDALDVGRGRDMMNGLMIALVGMAGFVFGVGHDG